MKRRCDIIARGTVQKVGFRDFVEKLALQCDLYGSVENVKNRQRDVRIVCEGERDAIDRFLAALLDAKPPAAVVAVIPTFSETTGEFTDFEITRGGDELGERLDYAAGFMQDQSIKMGKMLEKQDQTIHAINDVSHKQDLTINAVEGVSNKQDTMVSVIKEGNEKLAQRQDHTTATIKSEFNQLEKKYGAISSTLEKIATLLEKTVRAE